MGLKNVQYVYAEDLKKEDRESLGIEVDKGLVAIETHNEVINRTPKQLNDGIVEYLNSLE